MSEGARTARRHLLVTLMSLSSSPVCVCGALPQPRSSRALAADTRAAAGAASWLKSPASTLMHSSVCPAPASANRLEFSFGANTYGVGLPPPVGAGIEPASASGVNYDHANNLTQNARTLPTENARPVAMLQIATPVCRARRGPRRRAT